MNNEELGNLILEMTKFMRAISGRIDILNESLGHALKALNSMNSDTIEIYKMIKEKNND